MISMCRVGWMDEWIDGWMVEDKETVVLQQVIGAKKKKQQKNTLRKSSDELEGRKDGRNRNCSFTCDSYTKAGV